MSYNLSTTKGSSERPTIGAFLSSKAISLGSKTWIKDSNGKELAYIEQELFHLMPNYNVFINGQKEFNIKKKFKFFKNDYELSNNYRVEGNFLNHNFVVYNNRNEKVDNLESITKS